MHFLTDATYNMERPEKIRYPVFNLKGVFVTLQTRCAQTQSHQVRQLSSQDVREQMFSLIIYACRLQAGGVCLHLQ